MVCPYLWGVCVKNVYAKIRIIIVAAKDKYTFFVF